MARSSTLVLADLMTANRLSSFRIGAPIHAAATSAVPTPAGTPPAVVPTPAGTTPPAVSPIHAGAASPAESPLHASAVSPVVSPVQVGAASPAESPGAVPSPDPVSIPVGLPVPTGPREPVVGPEVSDWNLDALSGRLVELSVAGASAALTAVTWLLLEAQLRREPAAWVAIGEATFYPPDMAEAGCDLENLPVVRVGDARSGARAADLLLRSGGFRLVVLDGVGSPYMKTRRVDTGRSRFYPGYGPAYSQNADRQARGAFEAPSGRDAVSQGVGARSRYASSQSSSQSSSPGRSSQGSSPGRFGDPYHRETSASIPPAAQARLAGLTKRHRAVLVCITYKERGASSLGALVSLRGTGRVRKTAFDRFTWEIEALKDKRRAPGWEHSGVCRGPTGLF